MFRTSNIFSIEEFLILFFKQSNHTYYCDKTGTQTNTLLFKNTRAWVGCSYPLSHGTLNKRELKSMSCIPDTISDPEIVGGCEPDLTSLHMGRTSQWLQWSLDFGNIYCRGDMPGRVSDQTRSDQAGPTSRWYLKTQPFPLALSP